MEIVVTTSGGEIGAKPFPNPTRPPSHNEFRFQNYPDEPVLFALGKGIAGLKPSQIYGESVCAVATLAEDDGSMGQVLRRVKNIHGENHLVTAGLSTILETAAHLSIVNAGRDKRIVLVGANVPLLNGSDSDGFQNLRCAVDSLIGPIADRAPRGVSIVLSDRGATPGSWVPKLFKFEPGRYALDHNPLRGDRVRIVESGSGAHELRKITFAGGHVAGSAYT